MSAGYPYFLQLIGKEVFDAWITKIRSGQVPSVPADEILEKLDQDSLHHDGQEQRIDSRIL
jgi:hypothetical protein